MMVYGNRYLKKVLLLLLSAIALVIFYVVMSPHVSRISQFSLVSNQLEQSSEVVIPTFITQWYMNESTFLLVIVVSSAPRFDQRKTVRQTWGTVDQRKDTEVVFLLATSNDSVVQARVAKENDLYGDIVQAPYSVLDAESTFLTIVHWVRQFRTQSKFVMKIADDCFLNPFNLIAWLVDANEEAAALFDHGPVDGACPAVLAHPSYVMTGKAIAMVDPSNSSVCDQLAQIPIVHRSDLNVAIKSSICESEVGLTHPGVSTNSMLMLWWFVNDDKLRGTKNACLKASLLEKEIFPVNV